jgi:hypothetical protein
MELRNFLKQAAATAALAGLQSAAGQSTRLTAGQSARLSLTGAAAHTPLP